MNEDTKWYEIQVEADFELLPTSVSGRDSGITSGYRPNHNFESPDNHEMRMGSIIVPDDKWINPGETKKVIVHFLMPEGYLVPLSTGVKWRIQEGGRHVGNGTVLRTLTPDYQVMSD